MLRNGRPHLNGQKGKSDSMSNPGTRPALMDHKRIRFVIGCNYLEINSYLYSTISGVSKIFNDAKALDSSRLDRAFFIEKLQLWKTLENL